MQQILKSHSEELAAHNKTDTRTLRPSGKKNGFIFLIWYSFQAIAHEKKWQAEFPLRLFHSLPHSPSFSLSFVFPFCLEEAEVCRIKCTAHMFNPSSLSKEEIFARRNRKPKWKWLKWKVLRIDGSKIRQVSSWTSHQVPELSFHIFFCYLQYTSSAIFSIWHEYIHTHEMTP